MSFKSNVNAKNAFIDKTVDNFVSGVEGLTPGIMKQLKALVRSGEFTYEAVLAIMAPLDLEAGIFINHWGDTLKYSKEMAKELGVKWAITADGADLLGRFTEQEIHRLLGAKEAIARNLVDAGLKWEMEGASYKSIIDSMQKELGGLGRRIQAEAFTGISMYESMLKSEQYRSAGIERFEYFGPVDSVTRDECRTVMADPTNGGKGYTRGEIDTNLPVGFIDRGGWNCRHDWIPYVE